MKQRLCSSLKCGWVYAKKSGERTFLYTKKTAGNYLLAVGGPEKTCTNGISKSPHRYYAGVGLTYSFVQKS